MTTVARLPLRAASQRLSITLAGTPYSLWVRWNRFAEAWILDIADINNNPIVNGIPLVTGANLLEQYAYLDIGGQLIAQTDSAPLLPPAYNNLGDTANLYFLT